MGEWLGKDDLTLGRTGKYWERSLRGRAVCTSDIGGAKGGEGGGDGGGGAGEVAFFFQAEKMECKEEIFRPRRGMRKAQSKSP